MRRPHAVVLAVLAVLAIAAYWPIFQQPLLQDDYPNIEYARQFGPVSGWPVLLANVVFRTRATFFVLTYWVDRLFGLNPPAFYTVSLGLHILCVWLVYALGAWRVVGWRISAVAAAFFAVHEGHQEAVMWYSANCELLMFLFGVLSLLLWIRFVEKQGGRRWYAASLAAFVLALLSAQSAAIFAPLFLLPLLGARSGRRGLLWWLPFGALAAGDAWLIFSDGGSSLAAPFWITLPVSCWRLLWVWGLLALLVVALLRVRQYRQLLRMAAWWIPIAFFPYCFLTYMHMVPSRQTYLASLGLAWIVAAGFWMLQTRLRLYRQAVIATVVLVVLAANMGILWTRKRRHFLDRAAAAESLVALARKVDGPIYMRCYPDPAIVYESVVRMRVGKPASILIWDPARRSEAVAEFCSERK